MKLRITENLDLDLQGENWCCYRCGQTIGPAANNYKSGCLVCERKPTEIHDPVLDAPYNFAPNEKWVRIVEFYCPGCGLQIETEYLPPGHPITYDIEIDIARLKERLATGELTIKEGRLSKV